MTGTQISTRSPDAGVLAAVRWMATWHSRPFSETALQARLPEGLTDGGVADIVRVLDAVGLKSRVLDRPVARIDPGSLPVLIFPAGGAPVILTGLNHTARTAEITDPLTDTRKDTDLNAPELARGATVVLVSPRESVTASRLSPHAQEIDPEERHWLWSELAAHKSAWGQVALAALGVNLAGLALPVFVMNVFDRVIPNLAVVTLVTLAIGVGLALAMDLLLRMLRSAIIQRVSRRADLAIASRLFSFALRQRILKRPGGAAGAITNLRDFEVVRDFFT